MLVLSMVFLFSFWLFDVQYVFLYAGSKNKTKKTQKINFDLPFLIISLVSYGEMQ